MIIINTSVIIVVTLCLSMGDIGFIRARVLFSLSSDAQGLF